MPRQTSNPDELPIIAKAYELLTWVTKHVDKFPRSHRFTLGSRLQNGLHDLMDALVEARFTRDRIELLNRCSIMIEQLRLALRLICDLKLLSFRSHEFAIRTLLDIGRQLGGWRRQQASSV